MSELKPCPFQKDGEHHNQRVITAMGESWVLCSCGATGRAFSDGGGKGEERAIEFWNTRYEPTCTMIPDPDYDFVTCSACGHEEATLVVVPLGDNAPSVEFDGNFCPNCGAAVTNHETHL